MISSTNIKVRKGYVIQGMFSSFSSILFGKSFLYAPVMQTCIGSDHFKLMFNLIFNVCAVAYA